MACVAETYPADVVLRLSTTRLEDKGPMSSIIMVYRRRLRNRGASEDTRTIRKCSAYFANCKPLVLGGLYGGRIASDLCFTLIAVAAWKKQARVVAQGDKHSLFIHERMKFYCLQD